MINENETVDLEEDKWGTLGGRKHKGEMIWVYYNLKNRGKLKQIISLYKL